MRHRVPTIGVVAAMALGLVWHACAAGAADAPSGAPGPAPDDAAVERIERQILVFQDRLDAFRLEELGLQMATIKAEWAAAQGLAQPTKAAEQIAKGDLSADLRFYRDTVLGCARQWRAFQGRFGRFAQTLNLIQDQRSSLPPPVQGKLDDLAARVQARNRSLLVRIAGLYEKIAAYRTALAFYVTIYQAIPDDQLAGETALKEKMSGLAEKCGDYATALTLLKSVMEARPEKSRYSDKKLGERLGDLYAKVGDLESAFLAYKATFEAIDERRRYQERGLGEKLADLCLEAGNPVAALDLYQRLYAAIPDPNREKDGAGLYDKIAVLERKLGLPRTPPPR